MMSDRTEGVRPDLEARVREHDEMLRMKQAIEDALIAESKSRSVNADWIERERLAVAAEANRWATAHDGWRTVTVEDVERAELTAIGHFDYGSKLALRVAELVSSVDPRGDE